MTRHHQHFNPVTLLPLLLCLLPRFAWTLSPPHRFSAPLVVLALWPPLDQHHCAIFSLIMRLPFIILLVSTTIASARHLSCLDDCVCDQADAVIRCDHGHRTSIMIPSTPLNGYKFIAFTCNNLRSLPNEALLKAAFPDIEGIDVQGNLNFNCSAPALKEIPVLSDCETEKPTSCEIDAACDWKCSTLKKLKELWKKFKDTVSEKFYEWKGDEAINTVKEKFYEWKGDKVIESVGNWFSETYSQITGDRN